VHEGPWIGCRRSQCMPYGHWLRVRRSLSIIIIELLCRPLVPLSPPVVFDVQLLYIPDES